MAHVGAPAARRSRYTRGAVAEGRRKVAAPKAAACAPPRSSPSASFEGDATLTRIPNGPSPSQGSLRAPRLPVRAINGGTSADMVKQESSSAASSDYVFRMLVAGTLRRGVAFASLGVASLCDSSLRAARPRVAGWEGCPLRLAVVWWWESAASFGPALLSRSRSVSLAGGCYEAHCACFEAAPALPPAMAGPPFSSLHSPPSLHRLSLQQPWPLPARGRRMPAIARDTTLPAGERQSAGNMIRRCTTLLIPRLSL